MVVRMYVPFSFSKIVNNSLESSRENVAFVFLNKTRSP